MIPKSNSFPVFEANQVLTKAHLNQMLNYLDEQTRLSRTNLIGVGIVCGLQVSWDAAAKAIHISKGVGVTTEGYLAHLGTLGNVQAGCTPTPILDFEADRYKVYEIPSHPGYPRFFPNCDNGLGKKPYELWELIPNGSSEYDSATPLDSDFIRDKVALLHVENVTDPLKNCSPNSCDDKGQETAFTMRPLLISKDEAEKLQLQIPGEDTLPNLPKRLGLTDLRMPRLNVPNNNMVEARQIFDSYRDLLLGNSVSMFDKVGKVLADAYAAFKPIVESVASGYNFVNRLQVLENQFKSLFNFNVFRSTKFPVYYAQYYYDLLSDLIQAYDEFRWKGLELLALCCPHESLFPRHLLLGEVISTRTDNWRQLRHYFRPSMAIAHAEPTAEEVRHLFERIVLMIEKFRSDPKTAEGIRITPSRFGEEPLSQKAIPYYFEDSEGETPLHQRWNHSKTRTGRATQNLGYFSYEYGEDDFVKNPLGFDLEPYNFFRIEGHIGRNWTDVLKTLMTAIRTFRLPFDVVVLNADNQAVEDKNNPWKNRCIDNDLDVIQRIWANEVQCLYQQKIGAFTRPTILTTRPPITVVSTKKYIAATPAASISRAAGLAVTSIKANTVVTVAKPTLTFAAQPSLFAANTATTMALLPSNAAILSNVNPATTSAIGNSILVNIDRTEVNTPDKLKTEVTKQLAGSAEFSGLSVKEYKVVAEHKVSVVADMLAVSEELAKPVKSLNYEQLDIKFGLLDQSIQSYVNDLALYNPNDKDATLTEAEVKALLNELQSLQSSCLKKRLTELKNEMDLKKKAVDELIWFSRFATNHPELQHKAGVPIGGTFVLVFRESLGDPTTEKVVAGIRQTLGYDIPEGKVLADFYLPNRCCSDCPPVKFVLPPSRPVFTVSLGCPDENDVVFATIEVTHGIAPFEISIDGSDYNLLNGGVELNPGEHTLIVRDSEGGESLKKKVTTGQRMKLSATFDCDANNEFFIAKIRIEKGQPPFKLDDVEVQHIEGADADANVFFISTSSLPSSVPVTLTVADSSGCDPVALPINHVCETPAIITKPNVGETEAGASITLDVAGDDTGEGLALTAVRLQNEQLGTVAITADGKLIFTPSAAAIGQKVIVEYEVTDSNGTTASSTATINVIKKQCDLPGEGQAISCLYRMWLQPPPNDSLYKNVSADVIKFVVNKSVDLTTKVPAFPTDPALLSPQTFHATIKDWVGKLNEMVQNAVPTAQKDWWKISYESDFGSYALLRIEHFKEHSFNISVQGKFRVDNTQTDFNTILSPETGSQTSEARLNLKSIFKIPQFDCIDLDKCNNGSTPRCNALLEIEIKNHGGSPQGGQKVVSLEGVDVSGKVLQWFWDMGQGISSNPNDRLTAATFKNNQGNLQVVRLFGFTKNGCYGMATANIDLDALGARVVNTGLNRGGSSTTKTGG